MRHPARPIVITAAIVATLVGTAVAAALLVGRPAAAAEIPKCSAPDALSGLQEVAGAQLESPYAALPPATIKAVHALRFPNGEPQLDFSQFVGKAGDEATRHCTARVELGSPGMAAVGGPFEYDLEMTEDGKLLYAPDSSIKEQLVQLLRAYDAENGLALKVLKLAVAGAGLDLSGSDPGTRNALHFNSSAPPPPLPGATPSNFGTPTRGQHPSPHAPQ